jgi:hypothetical protein
MKLGENAMDAGSSSNEVLVRFEAGVVDVMVVDHTRKSLPEQPRSFGAIDTRTRMLIGMAISTGKADWPSIVRTVFGKAVLGGRLRDDGRPVSVTTSGFSDEELPTVVEALLAIGLRHRGEQKPNL